MRIVGFREDRIGDVPAYLRLVDVEGGGELDIADMIAAELHIHQPRNRHVAARFGIMGQSLHEGRRAIADADNTDPELARTHATLPPISTGTRDPRSVLRAEIR